jgi:hypothetical protein
MTTPDNEGYAELMRSSAQLMDSLRVAIEQVQRILLKMEELFLRMPSVELNAAIEAKISELHAMGIGDSDEDSPT